MATIYGVYHTDAYIDVPANAVDASLWHGGSRRLYDEYVLVGEASIADVVKLFKLPSGARVHNARFVAPSDGTTGQWDIGWELNEAGDAADADGFIAGASADTGAGAVDFKMLATRPGWNKKFGAETQVVLTCLEATTASLGDTLKLEVLYTVN